MPVTFVRARTSRLFGSNTVVSNGLRRPKSNVASPVSVLGPTEKSGVGFTLAVATAAGIRGSDPLLMS